MQVNRRRSNQFRAMTTSPRSFARDRSSANSNDNSACFSNCGNIFGNLFLSFSIALFSSDCAFDRVHSCVRSDTFTSARFSERNKGKRSAADFRQNDTRANGNCAQLNFQHSLMEQLPGNSADCLPFEAPCAFGSPVEASLLNCPNSPPSAEIP